MEHHGTAGGATHPRVSIGLPVYNGAEFLGAALESILSQTFGDFELIISDNASTDATPDICRELAARDRRIVYHRQDHNIGQGPNHDFCVRQATGEYFRWAAHDDLIAPEYLARCVAELDRAPDAVLCHSVTKIIGREREELVAHLAGVDAPRASDRFAAVILKPHWCVDVYGLIRRSALLRTNLMSGYFGGDKTLLAELALQGRFLRVPEPLFMNRDHPNRSMRAVPFDRRQQFHRTGSGRARVTHWAMYTDYWRAVDRHVQAEDERARCRRHLIGWWFTNMHAARVSLDALLVMMPAIAAPMFRLRARLHDGGIGAAPKGGRSGA